MHEFMSLDGVIDTPTWTFEYGFDPEMGEAIATAMGGCEGILLGRRTNEMFEPAWSARAAEDDPGAPFMNDTTKYVVSSALETATWRNSTLLGAYDAGTIRRLRRAWRAGSTPAAAGRSCGHCWPTGWPTSCTSSSTR